MEDLRDLYEKKPFFPQLVIRATIKKKKIDLLLLKHWCLNGFSKKKKKMSMNYTIKWYCL